MIFAASEGLTRAAYGHHIQLFCSNEPRVAASTTHAAIVSIGYIAVPFLFAYSVTFYSHAGANGWWLPSSSLTDPNIVATHMPWFGCLAQALSAGVLEECLFRAVPIAGSTLLFQNVFAHSSSTPKPQPPWWWSATTQLVQAVIFGAAHANYPAQPAYARVCELIPLSFLFGYLYVRFGLVPGIILHFVYDVVWMSIPVFTSNLVLAKAIIIIVSFVPGLIAIVNRFRAGCWYPHPQAWRNSEWKPDPVPKVSMRQIFTSGGPERINTTLQHILPLLAVCSIALWMCLTDLGQCRNAEPLLLSATEAITTAAVEAKKMKVHSDFNSIEYGQVYDRNSVFPGGWEVQTTLAVHPQNSDMFVFESDAARNLCKPAWTLFESSKVNITASDTQPNSAHSIYDMQMQNGFLWQPYWMVRFARFDHGKDNSVNVSERADETNFGVTNNGKILWFSHTVPEHHPGSNWTESEAQTFATEYVGQLVPESMEKIRVISVQSTQRLQRVDWEVIVAHGQKIQHPTMDIDGKFIEGERRLQIQIQAGKISGWSRYIHVPELWDRNERSEHAPVAVLQGAFGVLFQLVRQRTLPLDVHGLTTCTCFVLC